MPHKIEDYAFIGDTRTCALVARDGSIDWLCVPRFDSPSCFSALLGQPQHGRWRVSPTRKVRNVKRRYVEGTLVLETEFETETGRVRVTDFMPLPHDESVDVVRVIEGLRGRVPMRLELRLRCDYGVTVPWVRRTAGGLAAVAGPNAFRLATPVELKGQDLATVAEFTVARGQTIPMMLTWHPSHLEPPPVRDASWLLSATIEWWRRWSARCRAPEAWHEPVVRSAITLKGLTHAATGGIVAAATTSLPEWPGGERNWDYRYCWVRDAAFTLHALMSMGYTEEAGAWRDWLERAVAGEPSKLQIMYGLAGERRLDEYELPWLPGFADSRPVRIGNGAFEQRQLDVYGEIMDAFHGCRANGLAVSDNAWRVQRSLMKFVHEHWTDPDSGIWEQRSALQRHVYSSVMAWVAADRTVKAIEHFGLSGPAAPWKKLRDEIHREVCAKGFNEKKNSFVQYFGGEALDAATLLIPIVGFLPANDPRVVGTVDAIQRELMTHGFVQRYSVADTDDGLAGDEGAFLACSFWLADVLCMMGRANQARDLFERLLDIRNDVGLLAEEYDPVAKRQLGNFPQAFSHVGLMNTARNLAEGEVKKRD